MITDSLPKYKKIEVAALGAILPAILAIHTIVLLLKSEAVFWGRSSIVIYHGSSAYLISLLWFGVVGLLLGHFLLRPLKLVSKQLCKVLTYLSATLVIIGLASAVVLV